MIAWKKRRLEQERQLAEREKTHAQFAAAALAGICGHIKGPEKKGYETGPQAHARWALGVADCMMQRGSA